MSAAVPIVRQAGEGERMWFAGGGVFTWKATSEETGGAFLLIEDVMVKGKTTPLHLHPNEDEALYVLDGEIRVHLQGHDDRTVGRGGFFFAPRGLAHAFLVTSDTAHVLAWQLPGSGEGFYRAAGEPVSSPADEARPPDWDRLRRAASESPAIEILGPPPFAETQPPARATAQ